MALVIDLSFILPRLDLVSSSSSVGLTKWNTLSSSNKAFPIGGKHWCKLSFDNSASYLFMHMLTENIQTIKIKTWEGVSTEFEWDYPRRNAKPSNTLKCT